MVTLARWQVPVLLYFFCRRRQQHTCSVPFIEGDAMEAAVLEFYGLLRLSREIADGARKLMHELLGKEETATKLLHLQLTTELLRLDTQEENLVDLVANGELISVKTKRRIGEIYRKRELKLSSIPRLMSFWRPERVDASKGRKVSQGPESDVGGQ
jgi:site-specific DNA recombinase